MSNWMSPAEWTRVLESNAVRWKINYTTEQNQQTIVTQKEKEIVWFLSTPLEIKWLLHGLSNSPSVILKVVYVII